LLDGLELSIDELLDKYFFNENPHTSCAVIETKYYNNIIEEGSIVKQANADTEEDSDSRQHIIDSTNNQIEDSEDTISSKSCSSYKYAEEDIEKFFASDLIP
jgi:hypothetical protein